jgi:type IV secretory pathway TraG/TraD family ATPase VirD4
MSSPVVTICTTSLTFNNSTFCPQTVFMCFVWIWEQTAIISQYRINWLVFITETESVYCAVRTWCLNALCILTCSISNGHYMYHQFNIQQFYILPTLYVFCVDLRTNSHYFPIQHKLTGFYDRDGECLLCGTDWVSKRTMYLNMLHIHPFTEYLTLCFVHKWSFRGSGGFSPTLQRVGPVSILGHSMWHLWYKNSGTVTVFSPSTSVSSVSIIPPTLHTYLHLHVALTRKTYKRAKLGNLRRSKSGSRTVLIVCFCF